MENNIIGGKHLPISAGEDNPLTDDLYLKNGTSSTGYYPSLGTSTIGNLVLRSGNNVVSVSRADGDASKQIILMPSTAHGMAGTALLGYAGSPWADGYLNNLHVNGNSLIPANFTITYASGVQVWGTPIHFKIGNIAILHASFQVTGSNVSAPFTISEKPSASASLIVTRAATAGDGGSWVGSISSSTGTYTTTNGVALKTGYYKGVTMFEI